MSETPQVDIVVPVKNEERDLTPSVTRLVGYLRDAFPFTARMKMPFHFIEMTKAL